MMDFAWYILGALTGAVAYALYLISRKNPLNWLLWSGLIGGSGLILFSIAWAVGCVLEGVPRAARDQRGLVGAIYDVNIGKVFF